ncbi:DUF2288 domain-containing protein [Pseudomonas sp. N040]|uniref:DUF2288 domain-containing protein n=1 Tax=Pseudomonas sp. N040 TaxID=2785325 RepID=UPI0018A338A0|nr:DUF2288 family protein [Pseudomonas sp. N040]MBF7729318.1 DUF2288 domain-containing protein [Pseudomonas sp. N040]MBW7012958.1 DUF2288 domain-containing protein [Pseudomonas sp. N040]
MTTQPSPLYLKLLGETARIRWQELQPFFARGALLWVAAELDLVAVAEAVAQDDRSQVAAWLAGSQLAVVATPRAEDWLQRDPELWAVVVAPWVVIQERSGKPQLH